MDEKAATEVASAVSEALDVKAEVWPGLRVPAIRVKLANGVEARAEADGFWQVHFFDNSGTPLGTSPVDLPEATDDVAKLAHDIANAIQKSPHSRSV